MQNKKEEKAESKDQGSIHELLVCSMCGNRIEPDEYSWQEDGGGMVICDDCRAEQDSCGCSD